MMKIGLFTFGGGYAMIPLLENEFVSKRGWIGDEEFFDMVAVAESTPGPIAVNMATFIGAAKGGFIGALLSTVGVVLPAFIIMLLVAAAIKGLLKFAGVQGFLSGVRPVVVGLIIATGALMFLTVVLGYVKVGTALAFDWKALVIFGLCGALYITVKIVRKKTLSPILLILLSALLGILLYGVI